MFPGRRIWRGIQALCHGAAADQQVADEIAHHLEATAAAYEERGFTRAQATRAARLDLGGVLNTREQVRSSGWEHSISVVFADLRYAARRLRGAPGFTAVAAFTLALGIGGTTAIFSAVYPILLAPLPYPQADRIIAVIESAPDGNRIDGTFAMYCRFLERAQSLEALAVFRPWQPSITSSGRPERLVGQRVSWGYFRVLGVAPMAGRDFSESDDHFNGPNVVILSDALWRRRFGGDPSIVGREIRLDDNLFTVVGVMPAAFENTLAPASVLWVPLRYDSSLPAMTGREWGHHLRTIARLHADVSVSRASAELNGIGRAVVSEHRTPAYDPNTQFAAVPLQNDLTRAVRPTFLAIGVAVTLVLTIACVNVANLLLGRSVQRRAELALRAALGSGKARLVRQLLTESVLLAALGGLAGIIVARLGVDALVALSPPGLPRVSAIRLDATVFGFCAALTTFIGLAFGLMPALQAARNDPHRDLQHASHRTADGQRWARSALVVAQVALAFILLVGSGLLLRSLERILSVPIGFGAVGVMTMQVQIVGHRFDPAGAKHRFFAEVLDAVRRRPGIHSAGFTSQLPLSGDLDEYGVQVEATPTRAAVTYSAFRYAVTPGYLETMQIPLRAGRLLDDHDGTDAPRVALVSESLASRFYGDPLGQRLRIGPAGPFTIVGVVGDVRQASLAMTASEAVYINGTQSWFADNPMSLVVRGHGDGATLSAVVREAIWSIDSDQPVARVATMSELVAASAVERRFTLVLFAAFAFTALVLAAAGIYGVISGSVVARMREIGVRAALGASAGTILGMVVRQGLALTALGIAIGILGAAMMTQKMMAMLFEVSPLDPMTYLAVVALLGTVSSVACAVPAWRAVHVDPARTLRTE